jgi:hypothetical protein
VIASGEGIPAAIEVDEARVYWVSHAGAGPEGGVKLRAAPKCGGAVTTLAVAPYFAEGLAQDDATLFFSTSIGSGEGAVLAVPKGGGDAVTLFQGARRPGGLAVDDAYVYFAEPYEHAVYRTPKAGGAPSLVAVGLAPQGTTSPTRVALLAGAVFAAGDEGVCALGSGAPVRVFDGDADDLRVAGASVVIASGSGIFSLDPATRTSRRLSDGGNAVCASAHDAAFVTGAIVELHRVSLAGGTEDVLDASGGLGPGAIVCDDAAAFWTAGGQVRRTSLIR